MKNHSFIAQIIIFSSILLIFILPPFFAPLLNQNNTIFTQWNFPLQQLLYAIFALMLFFYFKNPREKIHFLRFPLLLTVGLLFFSSLIIKFASEVFRNFFQNYDVPTTVLLPKNTVQWIFCILTFLFAAFFEEVIYRFYFVDALIELFNGKFVLFFEILGCLVFAFAHYYLGWLSVINAVFGHIILRICYKKNKTLYPSVAAHFIYNVISLILL